MTPAQTLTAAAEHVLGPYAPIITSNLAWAIAEWLKDAAAGDDHGEHNPYASPSPTRSSETSRD